MPTIGIYVPIQTARMIASRWNVTVDSEDLVEVVRNLTAESLADAAGMNLQYAENFNPECPYAHLHKDSFRCRHCGGS